MARSRSKRPRGLYWKGGFAYGDFRRFADVGGKLEGLRPPRAKRATTDPDVAAHLYAERLRQLEQARRDGALGGQRKRRQLQEYIAYHLCERARTGKVERAWIAVGETMLRRAVEHFGPARYLDTVGPAEVQAWLAALGEGRHSGSRPLGPGSQRHHLGALSNLYRRAMSEEVVPPGYNPAAALLEKPAGGRDEARWLEVPDAALLLEAARTLRPSPEGGPRGSYGYVYPLVATFLFTGGREGEVLGLELDDVSFDRGVVTFRPNAWRRLKTRGSHRTVPLWPQLAEILRPYADQRVVERGGTLLFPGETGRMLTDWRKLLDRVAVRAGWKAGEIRSKRFRHTYCAARLQTLDHGAPVSVYTVSRELGHGSTAMVEKVYSHLGAQRHRSDVVEYRVEQHAAKLGDRLTALRAGPEGGFVTQNVTRPQDAEAEPNGEAGVSG